MNEWEENISFYVVFVGAVYWEIITMMVDYTDFEEERLREKKGKMYVFTITSLIGGPPQREEILREIKMKRFLNFYYATTNEWMRGEHKFL